MVNILTAAAIAAGVVLILGPILIRTKYPH